MFLALAVPTQIQGDNGLGFQDAVSSPTPKHSARCAGPKARLRTLASLAIVFSPNNLSTASIWLAYYASLPRPRSLSRLLCRSMPGRGIIEGGPPERITNAFGKLFVWGTHSTNVACARARHVMGWPRMRPDL